MTVDTSSFGKAISNARKILGISQKDLANKILKEDDGQPITPQYLNDIEHDRRSPSSDHIVKQLSKVLKVDADILYWLAGRMPEDVINKKKSPEKIQEAFLAFRQVLKEK
jgi:transcriptional regulator with XRE-family HTH domain